MSDYLPPELVVEILIRLPPTSLIRCSAVCRSWRDLIARPSFISRHRRRSPRLLLMQVFRDPDSAATCHSLRLGDDPRLPAPSSSALPLPPCTPLNRELAVVGICDGLLCLTASGPDGFVHAPADHQYTSLLICNPSLRRYVSLPRPKHYSSPYTAFVAFGFDSIREDYKVLRLSWVQNLYRFGLDSPHVEVYSLATGLWKDLGGVAPACTLFFSCTWHCFVDGVAHWNAVRREGDDRRHHFALSFDFSNEAFGEVLFPENMAGEFTIIRGGEGLSAYVVNQDEPYCCDVWTMKEYGVVESWNKVYSFCLRDFSLDVLGLGRLVAGMDRPLHELFILNSGEVLLLMDKVDGEGYLCLLDIARKRFIDLGIAGMEYAFHMYANYYAESLVLLNKATGLESY